MPLGLTWLDVLLIVALAMLLVQGHRRGLWVVLGNLVGLVGGAASGRPRPGASRASRCPAL